MTEPGMRKQPKAPEKARAEKYQKVFEQIYRLVLKIPPGRVMTYGQIARELDDRYSPRLVGWAMHATPQDGRAIPWHRVINSKGGISTGRIHLEEPDLQRYLLEAEGITFDARGQCDLSVFLWMPRRRRADAAASVAKTARRQAKAAKSRRARISTRDRRSTAKPKARAK